MIFSLSEKSLTLAFPKLDNTDIICFFHRDNALKAPAHLWFEIALTSLKNKRNVLILEEKFQSVSELDFNQRWQIGEAWLWIAPRAHSVLLASYPKKDPLLENLRSQLINSK